MATLQTAIYTNAPKYISQYYYADRSFAAKAVSVAADRYKLVSPNVIGLDVGGYSLDLVAETTIDISQAASWDTVSPTDYTVAANRAGKDFYVYAVVPIAGGLTPTLLVSANSTYPSGYDSTNSRKVGGFHCLCVAAGTISSHPATGYLAGDIIPTSVWDLKFRCENMANEGLCYDSKAGIWGTIYLVSGSASAPASVFGGTILNTITWMDANDAAHVMKMRQAKDWEFTSFAYKSNEGTNITGSADPVTTGGHVDTAGRRCISACFAEDCCGIEYQWLDEHSFRYDASVTFGWVNPGGNKGKLWLEGSYDVKLLAGGSWRSGAYCGSRGRYAYSSRWSASASIGCRFVARSLTK